MPLDLTLSPSNLELVLAPGGGLTQAYQITNTSDSSIVLYTSIDPWKPVGPDGSVSYEDIPPIPSYSFSLSNSDLALGQSFVLKPQESRQLVLKIKSLPNTPGGDSYFTFFINQYQSSLLGENTDNQVGTLGRLGSHILISSSATPEPKSEYKIINFSVSPKTIDLFFPRLNFQALIENTSPYYNRPAGKIIISKNNSEIKSLDLYPHNVLSQSTRHISCLSPDKQPVDCTLSPPFWPGPYTAALKLDSGPEARLSFFVFPYTLSLIILLILSTFFIYRKVKHPKKK